mmetsp:Transcript_3062/g.7424  ORF Transcript_3062/g.7424 Transcript_3062/m.7424 type:complete len:219 (+) Transcript_3062:535-1191(+)
MELSSWRAALFCLSSSSRVASLSASGMTSSPPFLLRSTSSAIAFSTCISIFLSIKYFGICPFGLFLKESVFFDGPFSFKVIEATFLAACSATLFLLPSTKFFWPGYTSAFPARLSFPICTLAGFDSCSFRSPLIIDCSLTDILLFSAASLCDPFEPEVVPRIFAICPPLIWACCLRLAISEGSKSDCFLKTGTAGFVVILGALWYSSDSENLLARASS